MLFTGGFLILFVNGAKDLSLDNKFKKAKMSNIEVKQIIKPIIASDGAGVKLKRSIGS